MFRSLAIIRELKEDVGEENLRQMSQANAELLTKVSKANRTADVVKAAQILPNREFRSKIVEVLPPEEANAVSFRLGPYIVHKEVYEVFSNALDRAEELVKDGDRSKSLTEKALEAIAVEFMTTYGEGEDQIDMPDFST
jgi:hypothetical protein